MKNLKNTMRNTLYLVLGCVLWVGCTADDKSKLRNQDYQYSNGKYKNFGAMLDTCKGVTIVVWVGYNEGNLKSARHEVVVTDSEGRSYHYAGGQHNLKRGDTLKWVGNAP
jgi:hypothetical protein